MNVVVIGLGSMGRRRIRLINQYNNSYKVIGVDINKDRRMTFESEFGIETRGSLEEALKNNRLDCAFICSSPISHSKFISLCLLNNLHVFSELNLVADGYDENIILAEEKNRVLFLSSTFLYRTEINEIDKLIKKENMKLNYFYHVGQYLPDWHPWENYQDYFVGSKRTNGCREILAIELPWLVKVFGHVKDIVVKKSKISALNIEYNDNYMIIMEHESGHRGMFAVDIVSRKAVRNLEIISENIYLAWDGSADGLRVMNIEKKKEEKMQLYEKVDQLKQYSKYIVENAYYNEIETFFETISGHAKPMYNFNDDKVILGLIDRIEA